MIGEFVTLSELSSSHNNLHRKLYKLSFAIMPEVSSVIPTLDTLPNMTGQFYDDGITGTRRLYINFNGHLVYFEGKNV